MTRRALGLTVLGALVGILVFGRWADRIILWPETASTESTALEDKTMLLGEKRVHVFIARRPAADLYVLRLYGNADRAEPNVVDDARHLGQVSAAKVEVWGVDYPGYGPSDGPATLDGVARSSLLAFDAMRAQSNGKPCYIVATSLGTTGALHVAAERTVDGLVIQNPPALRQMVLRQGWWNLWLLAGPIALQVPSALDSLGNAARAKAPAIFVLSGADEVVPPDLARRVYDAYAGPKQAIVRPTDQHNDPLDLYRAPADRMAGRALLHR